MNLMHFLLEQLGNKIEEQWNIDCFMSAAECLTCYEFKPVIKLQGLKEYLIDNGFKVTEDESHMCGWLYVWGKE